MLLVYDLLEETAPMCVTHEILLGQQTFDNHAVVELLGISHSHHEFFYDHNGKVVAKWQNRDKKVIELFLSPQSERSTEIFREAKVLGEAKEITCQQLSFPFQR